MLSEEFKLALHDLNRPIDDEMRDYYHTFIPPNVDDLIEQNKREIRNYVNKSIEDCINDNDFDFENSRITIENLYIKLSDLGFTEAIHHYHYWIMDPYGKIYIERVWKETLTRFQLGDPLCLNLLARFLGGDLINTITLDYTLDDRLRWLRRLAELGVDEAQTILVNMYYYGHLGIDNKIKVNLTDDERFEGLRHISLLGSKWAQKQYGCALYNRGFLRKRATKDDQWIREKFKELIKIEIEFNFYVTYYYVDRSDLTLKERLSILENRARKGDSKSYDKVIEAYKENILGETSLNLSKERRWQKLLELKEIDTELWKCFMTEAYLPELYSAKEDRVTVPLSQKERFKYVFDQALSKGNFMRRVEEMLSRSSLKLDFTDHEKFQILYQMALGPVKNSPNEAFIQCLIYNRYYPFSCSTPDENATKLNLDSEDRLEALISLIQRGVHEAMWKLGNIILGRMMPRSKDLLDEILSLKNLIHEKEITKLILFHGWNSNLYEPLIFKVFPDKERVLKELMRMKYIY